MFAGTNGVVELAKSTDVPAPYVHPTTKQCNYTYTHPSQKQCSYEPDLSNYITSDQLENIALTKIGDFLTNQTIDVSGYLISILYITTNFATSYGGSVYITDDNIELRVLSADPGYKRAVFVFIYKHLFKNKAWEDDKYAVISYNPESGEIMTESRLLKIMVSDTNALDIKIVAYGILKES